MEPRLYMLAIDVHLFKKTTPLPNTGEAA